MTLEVALQCAERGFPVFPVRIDPNPDDPGKTRKTPLVPWSTEATTDEATIRRWWRQHGNTITAAGRVRVEFGIPTGQRSGLYVVDVDRPGAVAEAGLSLSGGRRVATNRPGGEHYYFGPPLDGRPVRNSAGGGLDVRGEGGFVVVWSSPPEGTLQPLPASVATWARNRTGTRSMGPTPAEVWPEGDRHDRLVRIAAAARNMAGGATEEEILGILKVFNLSRCVPVLDDEWLEPIARSYAAKEAGTLAGPSEIVTILRARRARLETEKTGRDV